MQRSKNSSTHTRAPAPEPHVGNFAAGAKLLARPGGQAESPGLRRLKARRDQGLAAAAPGAPSLHHTFSCTLLTLRFVRSQMSSLVGERQRARTRLNNTVRPAIATRQHSQQGRECLCCHVALSGRGRALPGFRDAARTLHCGICCNVFTATSCSQPQSMGLHAEQAACALLLGLTACLAPDRQHSSCPPQSLRRSAALCITNATEQGVSWHSSSTGRAAHGHLRSARLKAASTFTATARIDDLRTRSLSGRSRTKCPGPLLPPAPPQLPPPLSSSSSSARSSSSTPVRRWISGCVKLDDVSDNPSRQCCKSRTKLGRRLLRAPFLPSLALAFSTQSSEAICPREAG